MEIERLELDGFGRFHDARWTFDSGATVFLGANEAGKTTLLNALRALLFGFEQTRDGRTWYPPLAGGRRGGRLGLRLASGERWSVERHGERGGAGALAVRAPNGNQGGQETLDRLLHGADRDLFNNVFAFGLGELQSFSTLSTDGVRGRIYGAGAGLGGTSAVDLERRLRQQMDGAFLPRGREKPLNAMLARIEGLRGEIADLARQPEEHEAAHRERAELESRAQGLRELARVARARRIRIGNLRAAAPIAAELAAVESELSGGDPILDSLPPDAVAQLDRRLGALAESRAVLASLDGQIREATVARAGLQLDDAVLAVAADVAALREERSARAGDAGRRSEVVAAETRHAATVAEQIARAGGWEESRLVALDTSIVALEATRDMERALNAARSGKAAALQRGQAAADELAARENEAASGAAPVAGDIDESAGLLRRLDQLRLRQVAAEARGSRPRLTAVSRVGAGQLAAVGLLLGIAGLLLGMLAGAPIVGALVGVLLAAVVFALGLVASRTSSQDELLPILAERADLLARLGLPADATDERIARLADEIAARRARRDLAEERHAGLGARRAELERLAREAQWAASELEVTEEAWHAWLTAAGMPVELSPEAARQVLAAAGTARQAAAERERQRALLAGLTAQDEAFASRVDALLATLALPKARDAAHRDALLAGVVEQLDRARDARRRATELDATLEQLCARREPAAMDVGELDLAVKDLLGRLGSPDPDDLRARDAAAVARRALQARARELRARLSGIAGATEEAVTELFAALRSSDLAELEAEEPEAEAEVGRLEAEERDAVSGIGALKARITQLEAAEDLGTRRQMLAVLEGQAAAAARAWAVRAVALSLFEETRSRYERERQPDVLRSAEGHFERITGGRYSRIVAPPGDGGVRVETDGGESRVTEELSRGTAEQLYLALRFGLIEEFARQAEPLPVVMDDILVNFDPERADRAATAIRDLAARHQVLYFTCHRWTAELVDPGGARTITLD